MSATPGNAIAYNFADEATNAKAVPRNERTYGIHEWRDRHGNHGMEVLGQRHIRFSIVRVDGLFDPVHEKTRITLANYFSPVGDVKRKVFVVVDECLLHAKVTRIKAYFAWCKMEKLIEDYMILPLAANEGEKTLRKAKEVITAAKRFRFRRRDLFVAIGGRVVTDIVGFTAAIYRRSVSYISVPTTLVGILNCHSGGNKVSVNHINNDGQMYNRLFTIFHPPIASLYDLSFVDTLDKTEITRGLAEIVKISVVKDEMLFSYLESHLDEILTGSQGEYLTNAVKLAARAAFEELSSDPLEKGSRPSMAMFGVEVVRAIERIKGMAYGDADAVAIAVALMSALSFLKNKLSHSELGRVLNILEKAGLPISDDTLMGDVLWKYLLSEIEEQGGDFVLVMPITLGKGGCLNFRDISPKDVDATLDFLRRYCSENLALFPKLESTVPTVEATDIGNAIYEWSASEDVQYHVASVQRIFSENNPTIIQNYCVDAVDEGKRKILVIVDDYFIDTVVGIGRYFERYNAKIDDFRILSMHVSSKCKNMDSVVKVINAAIGLSMSRRDLFVVLGGGTLMDIVGFAAAIYKGGIRYIRIPTTLLGIIDAGVGVKVGVNFGDHKNFIGTYFAPVACLNDPAAFLGTLPQREFACGIAEAIKMALIKSPILFDLIERHCPSTFGPEYDPYTNELIRISIRAMLEELQPNLHEKCLRRLVDFGHEFGHIIESLAGYEIPHGECVAIGMAISSYLAYLKGILPQTDLDRILCLILDIGLPIYVADYDCCNPDVLWKKICTEGIDSKNGMLYLAVPETIGRGRFLDNISDIDAAMVSESVRGLKRYADWYTGRNTLSANGFNSLGITTEPLMNQDLCIILGWIIQNVRLNDVEMRIVATVVEGELLNYNFGEVTISRALGPMGHEFLFSKSVAPLPNIWTSLTTMAAITGASGEIESQFANYRMRNGCRVIRSIGSPSLHTANHTDSAVRLLIGDRLNLPNLQVMIQEADILYKMPGIVTPTPKPDDFAKIIAVIGFVRGIIARLARQIGRDKDIKVVYPSSQQFNLTSASAFVDAWVQEAAEAYFANEDFLLAEQNIIEAMERFSEQFIAIHPLPNGSNVCDISKRLGEHFVTRLKRHSVTTISRVYGPSCAVGLICRTANAKLEGNVEPTEKRHFNYIDDVNDILLKAVQTDIADSNVFDGASGEGIDLRVIWMLVTEFIGDSNHSTVVFKGDTWEELNRRSTFSRNLLGRDFVPLPIGLRKTTGGYDQSSAHGSEPITYLQYPEPFERMTNEDFVEETALLRFTRCADRFRIRAGQSGMTEILERSLNKWFNRLSISRQEALTEYMNLMAGLPIRLRGDAAMTQLGEFSIEGDEQHSYQGFIDFHAGLATRIGQPGVEEKIDDIVGHEGHHLLAFLLRGRKPLLYECEREREETMARKWMDFLGLCDKPHVIVLDVGATNLRIGVLSPRGDLINEPARFQTPSNQLYPDDELARLQERLVEMVIREIDIVRASHFELSLNEIGISFGAVVTREGVVEDASILWNDSAHGYNLKNALQERLPDMRLTIVNDISAAAWRYKDEGRFCIITVSSGLSNKVFNPDLRTTDRLDLDAAGLGGEMGHVIVEPRAVDAVVRNAIVQATAHPEKFSRSKLHTYTEGNVQKINARCLGLAAKEKDDFTTHILDEGNVPYCACGNLADLCAYSSGRGALQHAKRLAARGGYDVVSNEITDDWLKEAIAMGHRLGLKVLCDSTYPLALRILQLAADIGLDKFIITGGFAMKVGKTAYLQVLQDHLVRFCHRSGYFIDWGDDKVRGLVKFAIGDDNDGLVGVGLFVQHLRAQYQAVVKAVGEKSVSLVTRSIPRCGAREILAKIVFSGICTTDLQILRGERGLEPGVLGHECVGQVVEVGRDVRGLSPGLMIVLNPNNPLDDSDKLGHSREGVFQQYFKFDQDFLDRKQVLTLGVSAVSATDTLIEPLSCVVAAQNRIKERITGKNILVVGAGVMGLLFVLVNLKSGARNVFLANRSKEKLDFAVAKGIIPQGKVFAIGKCVAAQVDEVSAGEGVDIVIVAVSLGQGVSAAQDAITYVNAGGCVYLFAGFRPGDVMPLNGGTKVDITSIRSGWRTEQVKIDGKTVDLTGHRGFQYEDFVTAARLIRADSLYFGRVISHIISLDSLPEIIQTLARGGNILGAPAKRVIVDMDALERVVEFADYLPLRHLHEAARKPKDAIPMGNPFREIGFENSVSLLGWIHPPAWYEIEANLETALRTDAMRRKKHFIFCGTGGWIFLVDALKTIIPASHDRTLHILQSLDPQALVDVFACVKDLSMAVCIGISKSGKTLETVILMNTLRERFNNDGLDYREHFLWVTDTCTSQQKGESGEAVIKALKQHDWKDVDIVPLTVKSQSGINALFCAPHSMVNFLTLVLLLHHGTEDVRDVYRQYLAFRVGIIDSIVPRAHFVASNNIEHLHLNLDESVAPTMGRLVIQLIEQALGSKQDGFNPRVHIDSSDVFDGFEVIALRMPIGIPAVVKLMLTMCALEVFGAIVAYHRRIAFVTHPKVDIYKRKAVELMAAPEVEEKVSDPETMRAKIIDYCSNNPRTRFVEIMFYGQVSAFQRERLNNWFASFLAPDSFDLSIEVVQGEEWNHSVYQAAVQTDDTLYVILVPKQYCSEVEGVAKKAIYSNIRMLEAIARATYETLRAKALYFRVGNVFSMDKAEMRLT